MESPVSVCCFEMVCMWVYVWVCMHVGVCACMCVCACVCVSVCMHVYMRVCMHVCVLHMCLFLREMWFIDCSCMHACLSG